MIVRPGFLLERLVVSVRSFGSMGAGEKGTSPIKLTPRNRL